MRPAHGAEHVVGVGHGLDPVPQASVDRVLERPRPILDLDHRRPELLHPENVGALARNVFGTHVNHALEAEAGRHRGRRDSVLAGPRLGDHALLSHAPDEEALPHDVVQLVGAGVIQVLPLHQDSGAAQVRREVLAGRDGRRPARVA